MRGWRVGRVGGIEIFVDPSLLVIAALITFNLWAAFTRRFELLGSGGALGLALFAAGLFFLSILAHELAHAGMSRLRDIPVAGITLFMFGGATHARIDARGPGDEFLVTVVGPATSGAVGGLFLAVHILARESIPLPLTATFRYLALINLTLAVFNLLPGFPLDGGRLLRSAVWWVTGNLRTATRVAARVGQAIGLGLVGLGLFALMRRGDVFALWPALIGWFLFQAASSAIVEGDRRHALASSTAGDVMSSPPPAIAASLSLAEAMARYLDGHEGEAFPVVDDGRVVGLISPRTVREVPSARIVGEAMADATGIVEVRPDESMHAVAERMRERGVETALVVEDGRLVGVIEPEDLRRALRQGGRGEKRTGRTMPDERGGRG